MEQIETVGSIDRDPRGWSVSVIYSALIPYDATKLQVDAVDDVAWVGIDDIKSVDMAFDHRELISKAMKRYKQKALYSFVPVFALTQPFTVTELRRVHEFLIGQPIQRKSFIRRAEASDMLKDTGKTRQERGRPAALYKAKKQIAEYRFIRNIEAD